jgi:hypothetical protein
VAEQTHGAKFTDSLQLLAPLHNLCAYSRKANGEIYSNKLFHTLLFLFDVFHEVFFVDVA